jgi:hypothetical protein
MAYVVAFQASYLSTRRHECRVKSDLKSNNNNKRSLFESHSTARLSDLWEFVSGSFRRDFLYRYMHFAEIASAACNSSSHE